MTWSVALYTRAFKLVGGNTYLGFVYIFQPFLCPKRLNDRLVAIAYSSRRDVRAASCYTITSDMHILHSFVVRSREVGIHLQPQDGRPL